MDAFCTEKHLMQTLTPSLPRSSSMTSSSKKISRKRQLGVETLESRFNLSAAGALASAVTELQAARLNSTTQLETYNKLKPLTISLSSLKSTANAAAPAVDTSSVFGDTSISTSSATAVPVTDYSSISNARIEYQNGAPNIGFMASSGVAIEYKLNVAAGGSYKLDLGVASPLWSSFDVYVNGGLATQYAFSPTGGWSNFAKTTGNTINLNAGSNTLRIVPTSGSQFNINAINLTPGSVSTSTTPAPASTGGTISLTTAGADIAVDKNSALNASKIEYAFGGPTIGYVANGAYVDFNLNVQSAGNYTVSVPTAAPGYAAYDLLVNGSQAASFETNGTGSWSNFQAISRTVYLNAGSNTFRLAQKSGTSYNLGTVKIAYGSSSTTTTPSTPPPTTPSTPQAPASWNSGGTVAINNSWMTSFNQLNVTGSGGNDSIYVAQSGDTLAIQANGNTTYYTASSYGELVIKGGDGNDTITVDGSVRLSARIYGEGGNDTLTNKTQGFGTIVSIGGGSDVVIGNGWSTSIWADSADSISGAGATHRVSGFWGGVSTELQGQNLNDPAGTGSTTRLTNSSLWGQGPTMEDVTQGLVTDCYLLAPLQSMAYTNPNRLRELAVDLGDGTYAVHFKRGGVDTFVRVDGDLPAGGYYQQGLNYAHPGASGNQWMPIIEKAYAEFRTGAWSYESLRVGNFNAVLADFGVAASGIGGDANTLFNQVQNAVNSGKGVTYGTFTSVNSGAPLIGFHTYTITKAWRDASGTGYVTMRNPWGYDGAGWDSNTSDGLVTLSMYQMQSNMQAGSIIV
jgi:hypothetical protein